MALIRPTVREDHALILDILRRTDYFTEAEVESADKVSGYVCYGPTPLTDGTYDIYWIAVDPERQGKKIGSELLSFAENDIAKNKGRLITVYTSSQEKYLSTRNFYIKRGYHEGCRIKDYYRRGDDLVVYVKQISED